MNPIINPRYSNKIPDLNIPILIKDHVPLRPEFKSIEGFQNCIDFHEISSTGKQTIGPCLPKEQPELCTNNAWNEMKGLEHSNSLVTCSNRGTN